ncbi:hypothetical protein ABG768_009341 [Culter alburnus]|uniref:Uncharacterized protein n=1 Tax=Culter alburnus TaxID=194366 RepID=A0AAW1ZKV8_CULAL
MGSDTCLQSYTSHTDADGDVIVAVACGVCVGGRELGVSCSVPFTQPGRSGHCEGDPAALQAGSGCDFESLPLFGQRIIEPLFNIHQLCVTDCKVLVSCRETLD